MLQLRSFLLLSLSITANFEGLTAYSQVAINGGGAEDNGPRIFKSLNTDLIFPKIFNSSENVISTTETLDHLDSSSISSSSTTETPWPDNHRAVTEEPSVPIFVTPNSVALSSNEQQPGAEQYASTGRAVDYRSGYPFGQLLSPIIRTAAPTAYRQSQQAFRRPSVQSYSNSQNYAKPRQPSAAEWSKLRGRGKFSDRFTPGEAVASMKLKNQYKGKLPAPSDIVQTYVPAKNPYAFPPLIGANYPSPSNDPKATLPTSNVNSYLPPASGPTVISEGGTGYKYPLPSINPNGYKYPGPGKSAADDGKADEPQQSAFPADNGGNAGDDDAGGDDDTIGVLPASAMDMNGDDGKDGDGGNGGDTKMPDAGAGGDDDSKMPDGGAAAPSDNDYDPNKEYATPPPGWLEQHPESAAPKPADHDHSPDDMSDHDHYHGHDHGTNDYSDVIQYPHGFPSFHSPHDHHPYPELIYDDHHHYHHHPHAPPPPPPPPPPAPATTPPPPPPPEPAPEPRVKKYSYFYIGRKLWYIPLYFTVYFSFYVLWLIVKSIARHKVNLPNHYVNRRSLPDYSTQLRDEYLNSLTVHVLEHIDNFKQKHLT